MNLSEEAKNYLKDILKMTPEELNLFLKNIREPIEAQKHYEILINIFIQLHKFKSLELFESYINQSFEYQNYDEQIKLIATFFTKKHDMLVGTIDRFIDLRWRLNTKISSRVMQEKSNLEPKITIEILKNNQDGLNHEKVYIHSTPLVLNHLIQKLEQAFDDSKNIIRT